MIRDSDIGIVVQGDVRPNTPEVLGLLRRHLPGCQVIFSTFDTPELGRLRPNLSGLVDQILVNKDPGPLPATVRSPTAPVSNVNRQIRSTRAGLQALKTPFALKLRSDAEIDARATADLWSAALDADGRYSRIAVPTLYTRHPRGICGYLFHVSDWIGFGETDTLRAYWDADEMPESCARWFETHEHRRDAIATTRRFRAQFTPEQWICTQYARRCGFATPSDLYHRTPELVASYERFLASHCLVLDLDQARLRVPGHVRPATSPYQRLDCVSNADWKDLHLALLNQSPVRQRPLRTAARLARVPIARGILAKKWISARISASSSTRSR